MSRTPASLSRQKRTRGPVAIVVGPLGVGGIGTIVVQHAEAMLQMGLEVDVLILDRDSPFTKQLPRRVNLVKLASLHPLLGSAGLMLYLRRRRPVAILNHRPRLIRQLRAAGRISGHMPRLVTVVHNNLSSQLAAHPASLRLRRAVASLRACDGIVAVSHVVAEDAAKLIGTTPPISVAYPPLDVAQIKRRAAEPALAPNLSVKPSKYIIAVGRLEKQKDFSTLLQAFSRLDPRLPPLELVVLGEGRERERLTTEAKALGLAGRVHFAGFASNPYPWIAGSRLLVLASVYEGFGIVLAEALALGVPVVATDCPSGPAEILEGGRYGRLVPPGNPPALAKAMAETLVDPPDAKRLQEAVVRFSPQTSLGVYMNALGLEQAVTSGR